MSHATDSKLHRKTHSENHLRRDLVRNPRSSSEEEEEEENHGHYLEKISSGIRAAATRRRRRITGSDWKEFSRHCPHRQIEIVAFIYKIAEM
jgi:hypothetical protein